MQKPGLRTTLYLLFLCCILGSAISQSNFNQFEQDKEYRGIFYFIDAKGAPPQPLKWDQKLWQMHRKTLVALAKAYGYSEWEEVQEWYDRLDHKCWLTFCYLSKNEAID